MKTKLLAGIALAALSGAGAMTGTVNAADLGGSVKDGGYVAPLPEITRGGAGPCYFRGDVGYGFDSSPTINFPVSDVTVFGADFTDPVTGATSWQEISRSSQFVTDKVANTQRDGGVVGSVAAGCGWGGSRGIRAEIEFGFYGSRSVYGEPGNFNIDFVTVDPAGAPAPDAPDQPADQPVVDDPLHTQITSYSSLVNFYKDLGKWGNITPYVGGGVGVAYHEVDQISFTENPNLLNKIDGQNNIAFAWQAGAGIGYQISDRAIIDVGYRYLDLGKAQSGRADDAGFVNPRVKFDDIAEHQIKVGLRYHFGDDCCAAPAPSYGPLK